MNSDCHCCVVLTYRIVFELSLASEEEVIHVDRS